MTARLPLHRTRSAAGLHGVDNHGISMLPGYDRLWRTGRANIVPAGERD